MVSASRFLGGFLFAGLLLLSAPLYADGILEKMEGEVADIVRSAKPGIVSIEDERIASNPPASTAKTPEHSGENPGRRQPGFMRRVNGDTPKVGSGFSIGEGYIVTTADVLSGMKNPLVMTDDGRRIHATVVGMDTEMNIGLLRLATNIALPALKLGYSNVVAPGHFAISIGNQNGHTNTVALTLVAGIRNEGIPAPEHFYPGLIQIAGTVGAGTSGAPILNARGEVIGMIAAVPGDWTTSGLVIPLMMPERGNSGKPPSPVSGQPMQPTQANATGKPEDARNQHKEGGQPSDRGPFQRHGEQDGGPPPIFIRPPVTSAGFAVPIDDMKPVLKALEENRLAHCWLGVDMSDERKPEDHDGVLTVSHTIRVKSVYPDSPAVGGGLQPGDVLLTLNGKPITRLFFIKATTMRLQPGDLLEVKINRKGVEQTLNIKMAVRPDQNKKHSTQ